MLNIFFLNISKKLTNISENNIKYFKLFPKNVKKIFQKSVDEDYMTKNHCNGKKSIFRV